jgi:alkylation response protein AidB-like acyl-CoA dehydrogenase
MNAPVALQPAGQESRQVAEAAREHEWERESFMRHLFEGRFRLDLIYPTPPPDPEEQARAGPFLEALRAFAVRHIDGDRIDREGRIPEEVLDGLRALGTFGIKIPRAYGGLGLSQLTYGRALGIVAARCASTAALLSAHQSIGVPQPLTLFGTEAQKQAYLPRIAKGALSAFALTEPEVGSDPANMSAHAEPTADGEWVLSGEKLWCTNGPRAELMVVMARTPPRPGVRSRRPVTAFIVETAWAGVEVVRECRFMGLKGIANGVIRFDGVRVPAANIVGNEGEGLRLALVTLNTGRLSLPAFCATSGRASLEISRRWAAERVQWGRPIGEHDAVAQKLGGIAAESFAMEAASELASMMADAKTFDIRLEAALLKLWHSETAWTVANEALQIRGGRGYETADSLRARGETPYPVERAVRDLRINLIFEGTSEIMRLFIAREALDRHVKLAGALLDPAAPALRRLAAGGRAALHYLWWYPTLWLGWGFWPAHGSFGPLAKHVRFVSRTSRRLSRAFFHRIVRFGPALERRQAVLGRLVDIGAECFLVTAACIHAEALQRKDPTNRAAVELADLFCRRARRRVADAFRGLRSNDDVATYRVAKRAMAGDYRWLTRDVGELILGDLNASSEWK